jgi:hypothetical protein
MSKFLGRFDDNSHVCWTYILEGLFNPLQKFTLLAPFCFSQFEAERTASVLSFITVARERSFDFADDILFTMETITHFFRVVLGRHDDFDRCDMKAWCIFMGVQHDGGRSVDEDGVEIDTTLVKDYVDDE